MKVHEACVLVSSLLAETVTMQEVEFDPVSFMEQVVIPDITADGLLTLSQTMGTGMNVFFVCISFTSANWAMSLASR